MFLILAYDIGSFVIIKNSNAAPIIVVDIFIIALSIAYYYSYYYCYY